jgi:hypothetical protein
MDSSFYTVPVAVQHGSAATVRSCALYSRAALLAAHHPRGVPGSPIGETLICRTLGRGSDAKTFSRTWRPHVVAAYCAGTEDRLSGLPARSSACG